MSISKNNITALLFSFAMFISGNSFSADLIVQESGPVGTYASIGAAVTASVDGDRIIINNKPGGFPWNEDILINKSLTFLSAVDNDKFFVQGEYTIQHAPGREVNIIGMNNVDGSISALGAGATSRTTVNIMWCYLNSGSVDMDEAFFELNMASCTITSLNVSLVYGKVIGNNFGGTALFIYSDAVSESDSIHVVGNTGLSEISCNSTSHYLYISNNFIYNSSTAATTIGLGNMKNGPGTNVIRNNSIRTNDNGIAIGPSCAGNIIIYNNIIMDDYYGDYAIINSSASSVLIASFNFVDASWDNAAFSGFTDDGTNTVTYDIALNGLGESTWVGTVDGGTPGFSDYDLDLTRNDPGCYGGSYSHANFFPIDGTSSKVYYLRMPSEILVGGSNSVTGYSFDR